MYNVINLITYIIAINIYFRILRDKIDPRHGDILNCEQLLIAVYPRS